MQPWSSLPPREAWIEMEPGLSVHVGKRRFPRGKRGLKSSATRLSRQCRARRFPRGKRGLKFRGHRNGHEAGGSLPPREAWIEIGPTG